MLLLASFWFLSPWNGGNNECDCSIKNIGHCKYLAHKPRNTASKETIICTGRVIPRLLNKINNNPPPLPPSLLSTIHKGEEAHWMSCKADHKYYSCFVFDFPVENGPYPMRKARKEAMKNVGPDNPTRLKFSLLNTTVQKSPLLSTRMKLFVTWGEDYATEHFKRVDHHNPSFSYTISNTSHNQRLVN